MSTLLSHQGISEFNLQDYLDSVDSPEQQQLVEQLAEFELGRFLLANKGLNGYWTAYVILHAPKRDDLSELEHWLTHHSPIVRATRERFGIFKQQLQAQLKDGIHLASLPCGLMDDLLCLDYSQVSDCKLTGIDLDQASIDFAKQNAAQYGIEDVAFICGDAWELSIENRFDVLTSNGLNVYQPDEAKLIELYQSFYNMLKPAGKLVTSFLTPPPVISEQSPWLIEDPEALAKQKLILADTCKVAWQNFCSEDAIRTQLDSVGFNEIEVIYDSQRMFPTVVARKP